MRKMIFSSCVFLCSVIFCMLPFTSCSESMEHVGPDDTRAQVTIGTLLDEMTDRDAVARYPELEYRSASFSSYDRNSTSKDGDWFANGDNNWFLRHEKVSNRQEFVLFEADGPGAVTRWWMTFAGVKGGQGYLRVYIDGADTPVIAGTPFQILSGNNVTIAPLAGSVSQLTPVEQRGHNLFYPIPYDKHCKITYCSYNLNPDGDMHVISDECIYYNVEYRTYAPGTVVESYSDKAAAKYADKAKAVAGALSHLQTVSFSSESKLDCTLDPGADFEVKLEGPAAIREIAMKLEAGDVNQALRSTVLEISFDGISTVFIPIGEFFGIGYMPLYTNMWYVDANARNAMTARWVMPFSREANVRIINYGNQKVSLSSAHVGYSSWNFDNRSMYFHAIWKMYPRLDTRMDPVTGKSCEHYDLNFVTLEGKGVYMGDSMSIFDTSSGWWGEGDEKIYIDDDTFPSIFGTGTEDYYGYAWCHPNTIVDHPFTSQPSGLGNLSPGYTFDSRHRCLDRIAFTTKLVFDMEMWHWNHSTMDLGISNYFYMLPGGKVMNQRDLSNVSAKTVLSPIEFVDMTEDKMDIEAEYMTLEKITGGNYETQSAFAEHWSNGAQVFWSNAPVGSEMTLSFDSPYEGSYKLKMLYAFSWDYGIFDIWFNNGKIETNRNLYDADLHTEWTDYGVVQVSRGKNTITVKAITPHPGIPNCFFGLDRVVLER